MARVVSLKNSSAAREARGREELVEVAVELFARNGFAGTSIRDIAIWGVATVVFTCERGGEA